VAAALAAVVTLELGAPSRAEGKKAAAPKTLRVKLTLARRSLRSARKDLSVAQLALKKGILASQAAAALSGTQQGTATPTSAAAPGDPLAALHKLVADAQLRVRRIYAAVVRLHAAYKMQLLIASCAMTNHWMPYIRVIARRYRISAGGLYRMMIRESCGKARAGRGSPYKGLFQYLPSTWRGSWNPWRRYSIFDGAAQIRATALAVKRGYGPRMWPATYPMSF
jgi:hypothetical protein